HFLAGLCHRLPGLVIVGGLLRLTFLCFGVIRSRLVAGDVRRIEQVLDDVGRWVDCRGPGYWFAILDLWLAVFTQQRTLLLQWIEKQVRHQRADVVPRGVFDPTVEPCPP